MRRSRALDWRTYISVDPEICHGKPCFRGTRIMISTVLEFLEDGASLARIKSGYPRITRAHVHAALRFAREAVESGQFAAGSVRHALPH